MLTTKRKKLTESALLAGAAALTLTGAGCAVTAKPSAIAPTPAAELVPTSAAVSWKDGSYTADGSYKTPAGEETVTVSVTIKDGTVVDVDMKYEPKAEKSAKFMGLFNGNYKQYVVGQPIDQIHLDKVSGSSLTSRGFNAALEKIMSEARDS